MVKHVQSQKIKCFTKDNLKIILYFSFKDLFFNYLMNIRLANKFDPLYEKLKNRPLNLISLIPNEINT